MLIRQITLIFKICLYTFFLKNILIWIEPKAQVKFTDCSLSSVHPSVRVSVCPFDNFSLIHLLPKNHGTNFNLLGTKYLSVREIQFFSNELHVRSFVQLCLIIRTVSQMSIVAHGPLVLVYYLKMSQYEGTFDSLFRK